ncbi:MAG TPA: glycosyl hydrolase family 28 protein [Terracidiphilus sp.]|nr:glycosyl hydrolase family 28 protein [Terracidiphilus sp.]
MTQYEEQNTRISRRAWLGSMALPAAGAAIASALMERVEAKTAPAEQSASTSLGARVYDVRAYGAKGDGRALDTAALQKAIDACAADQGGTVLVPAGTFVIGSVELKSNVTLRIAASGKLLGSGDGHQYHAVEAIPLRGDTTLEDGNWALLYAVNAHNITIEGPGTIDGQGAQFHSPVRGTPPPSGLGGNRRPYHFLAYRCENLRIRNLSLVDCAYHSIRIIQGKRVWLDGIYIQNRVNSNNDGFHLISTEHVALSNCIVKSGDDACAMFGSCKNITIANCFFSTRWSVFRFGGGYAENIAISNCVLVEVDGCPIKFQGDPGSRFENISFSNLVLKDVTGPISISIGGRLAPPNEKLPVIARNISFSHIHGTVTTNPVSPLSESSLRVGTRSGEGHSAIVLNCVNDSVLEKISFDDVHLIFGGGGTAEEARLEPAKTFGEYFVLGPIPAYALYARNCRGITLTNTRFEVSSQDLRPAVFLDNVEDVAVHGCGAEGNRDAACLFRFRNVRHALLTAIRALAPCTVFLQVEGENSEAVALDGGDLTRAAKVVTCLDGAKEDAVRTRLLI